MTEETPVFDYKYVQGMFLAASKKIHKIFTVLDYTWMGSVPSEYEINELLLRFYKEAETSRKTARCVEDCVIMLGSGRIRVDFDYYQQDAVRGSELTYDDITISVEMGNFWNHWNEDLGHGEL